MRLLEIAAAVGMVAYLAGFAVVLLLIWTKP